MKSNLYCPKCKSIDLEKIHNVYRCNHCGFTMSIKVKEVRERKKLSGLGIVLEILELIIDIFT